MPYRWFKHKSSGVEPFRVPYGEGQNTDAIDAAWTESGWKPFDPDKDKAAAKHAAVAEKKSATAEPSGPLDKTKE